MIKLFQHFELNGKVIIEHGIFTPPLKATESMEDEACFIYAVNGNSKLYGGLEQNSLSKDESVLVKCGSFMNHWIQQPGEENYEAVAIHLYPDILQEIYEKQIPEFLKSRKQPGDQIMQKVKPNEAIKSYIQGLLYYFQNEELVNDDLIKLKVRELIHILYTTNSMGIREMLTDLFNPIQLEFKDIIQKHIFEDFSVEDFAALTNYSLSSFKRKFKSTFGESPAKYIKIQRLEKAGELLRISEERITDICYSCGFNDPGHFSKSFITHFGISPSDYRKSALD